MNENTSPLQLAADYIITQAPLLTKTNVDFISAEIGKVSLMINLFRYIFQVGAVLTTHQK